MHLKATALLPVFLAFSLEGSAAEPAQQELVEFASNDASPPLSKDDLFGTGAGDTSSTKPSLEENSSEGSHSKTSLFGEPPLTPSPQKVTAYPIMGYAESQFAYTYSNPGHWSDIVGRLELGTKGHFENGINWKITGRAEYNAAYDATNHYADAVSNNERTRFQLGETYLDFSTSGLDWRIGRQQIVWGEMVGLFFADVVSAKDLRESILPDFSILRIPQWAARAEYFKEDFHVEAIWIPVPSYDLIGTPYQVGQPGSGSDFYPYPFSPAGSPIVMGESKPSNNLSNTNYGLRLSQLTHGWDYSGFVYSSMDSQPTFYRDASNPQVFYPRHDRIWQAGGTVAKDLGSFVFKAETVYTNGRHYNVTDLTIPNGLVEQDTVDWVLGFDFYPADSTRVNTQLFQRVYLNHADNTLFDKYENGFSLLVNHKFRDNLEAEALLIRSLNRSDWLLRPKLTWRFEQNWKWSLGVDVFSGPPTGLFGQYNKEDRVYTQVRYDF